MNILIIKNGKCKTYIDMLINNFDIKINTTIIHNSQLDNLDILPDGVIILGGIISAIQNNKNLDKILKLLNICENENIPVLGICLGCQLIAKYLGCEIKKAPYPIIGFKNIKILDENDTISKCIYKYNKYYLSLHQDYIIPTNELEVKAIYKDYPYYIKKNNFYGLQFHPDILEDNFGKFLKCFGVIDKNKEVISNYYNTNKNSIYAASIEILQIWIDKL